MNKLFSFAAEDAAKSIYGEPGTGEESNFDPTVFQGYDNTCAIRSQQIILRDFGIDVPQEVLMEMAENNGWYSEDGTPMGFTGFILQQYGVGVHQDIGDCTVYDLVNELAQGHRVIVGVDADELWNNDSLTGKVKNWFNDTFREQGGNHALIVAGIEVNPADPEDVTVVLTDPGTGDLRIEYSLDEFMDAWEDSGHFMVATNDAAPYQYDPASGCEIPSNIATEAFIANNSYPLSDYDIMIPEGYVGAHYNEGHLGSIPVEGHDIEFGKYQQALKGAVNTFGVNEFDFDEFEEVLFEMLNIDDDIDDDDDEEEDDDGFGGDAENEDSDVDADTIVDDEDAVISFS